MQEQKINYPFLGLCAFTAGLGGFLFGYDTAVINGANTYLEQFFALDKDADAFWIGLVTSSAIIGCIPGALSAGFVSDKIGRKKVLFLSAILFFVSAIWSAFPQNFTVFIIARFIGGLGIGFASMVCPVYIAEIATPSWRGRLGSLFQFGIVLGIFSTLFINKMILTDDVTWNVTRSWRWMIGSEVIPATLFMLMLIPIVESPKWLIQSGSVERARGILRRIGGDSYAEKEIGAVTEAVGLEDGKFSELFHAQFRKPLLIAVVIMIASQLSGINAIMYYSTEIFKDATGDINAAYTCSVWIGLVNLLATFIAITCVDKFGRKPLLLIGNTIQVLALGSVGYLFFIKSTNAYLLLGFVILYIAAFAMAMGPIPWILCSEIFPARVRGRAMSIATFSIWVGCYAVSQTFPMLLSTVGPCITFCIYAFCSALTLVFVRMVIPETKGKSLEDIEKDWLGRCHTRYNK